MASVADLDAAQETRLVEAVDALASAAFTGRRVVSPGHDRACDYLAAELEGGGFEVELQRFSSDARVIHIEEISATLGDRPLRPRVDFAEHACTSTFGPVSGEVVGADADVRGRWVLSAGDHPSLQEYSASLQAAGALGLLLPRGLFGGFIAKRPRAGTSLSLPILAVSTDLVQTLPGRLLSAAARVERPLVDGTNVVACLAGSDAQFDQEPLLIAAHYDGVGDDPGVRLPGAADNASGVAVVLEVARQLRLSAPWQRPLVIAFFDAEEVGMRGSGALADGFAAADVRPRLVNVDMVARFSGTAAVDASAADERLLLALDKAGRQEGIPLRVASVGSDNRRFSSAGLPAVGIALGSDRYHTPVDVAEAVDPHALAIVVRLVRTAVIDLFQPTPH